MLESHYELKQDCLVRIPSFTRGLFTDDFLRNRKWKLVIKEILKGEKALGPVIFPRNEERFPLRLRDSLGTASVPNKKNEIPANFLLLSFRIFRRT